MEFEKCNDELEMGSGFGSGGCGFKYVSHPCIYVNETGEQGDPGCGGENGCFTSCPVNIIIKTKKKQMVETKKTVFEANTQVFPGH